MLPAIQKNDPWMIVSVMLAQLKQSRVYIQTIKEWCRFLNVEAGSPESSVAILRADQFRAAAYKEWLKTRPGMRDRSGRPCPMSQNTIATKLHAMRAVYRALIRAGMLAYNPFDGVRIPKKDESQKLPTEIPPFEMIAALLDAPDRRKQKGRLWRALLAAIFGSGMRLNEARNLRISDFRRTDAGNYFVQLRDTKKHGAASQDLSPWAAERLREWVEERKLQTSDRDAFIFPAKQANGLPISESSIQRGFKRYYAQVGIEGCSVHSARAAYATALLKDGNPLEAVKKAMRHRSIATTLIYDKRRVGVDESIGKTVKYD